MRPNRNTVLFDLDSTIADTRHRQWMVKFIRKSRNTNPTWEDYSMACSGDTPIEGTVALMRIFASLDYQVVIVTGRSEAARDLTETWLSDHLIPWDALYMRPAGDRTPNEVYKVQTIAKLRERGYNPVLFVEDWDKVADYITEQTGVPSLLVAARHDPGTPVPENSAAV